MSRRVHTLGNPLNTTLNIELNDGTAYDSAETTANFPLTFIDRSITVIRAGDEIKLDPAEILVDKNGDSPVGEYAVLVQSLLLLSDGSAFVLQDDDDVKLKMTVVTGDGNRTWQFTFDIFDPVAGAPYSVELLTPNYPPIALGDPPPTLSLSVRKGNDFAILTDLTVVPNNLTRKDGTIVELDPVAGVFLTSGAIPPTGQLVHFDANFGPGTFDDGDLVEFFDGDRLTVTVRINGDAGVRTLSIPIVAPIVFGPRVF